MTSFSEAARELGSGPSLVLEVFDAATEIVATAPGVGDDQLSVYDEVLDRLTVSSSVLLTFEPALGGRVAAAIRHVAESSRTDLGVEPHRIAVLGRLVFGTTVLTLVYAGAEALVPLAAIQLDDEPLLAASVLRFCPLRQGDARVTYVSNVAWLAERPWRTDVAPLRAQPAFDAAVAEADLLLACLTAAHGAGSYSEGGAVEPHHAPRRLSERLRDPPQRDGLARLLDVDERAVDEAVRRADANVESTHRNGLRVRRRPIVG